MDKELTDKTMSRKWLLTINNPLDNGFTHEKIIETMSKFKSLVYWCMSDEIGLKEQTPHTHIFMYSKNGVLFQTLKKRFPTAHIDYCRGTAQSNKEYVFKLGKWANTEKEDTRIEDTQYEQGECPIEQQGARNDLDNLYLMIKNGMSDYEILEQSTQYMYSLDKIESVRQTINAEKYRETWRDLEVTYIWGETGTGKTRNVMEKYGYRNVYRVTDYQHPFDGYKGQDVIVFEEFRSSLYIQEMLKLIDGYPLELPCRYNNKIACYTKVFLISNIPLSQQYCNVQMNEFESYRAFLRRIGCVAHYVGSDIEYSTIDINSNPFRFHPCDCSPFDK